MTNSAKKPAKTSRDNLDLDLDARLDQATSTLSLDEEPPVGDEIDRVLAKAKKELDADISALEIATEDDVIDLDGTLDDFFDIDELNTAEKIESAPITSSSLASLESQLTAAMESTTTESDDDLDDLLGGAGFDFDSLLGDANDELTPDEAILNEDSLLAAVDELLNFGAFGEEEIEDNIVEIESVAELEPEVIEVVEDLVEIEPVAELESEVIEVVEDLVEIEPIADLEPEVIEVVEDLVEIEPVTEEIEPEVIEVVEDLVEIETVTEEIEPEVIEVVEDLVEIEPVADIEPETIENDVDDLNDIAEFELTVEPEAALDDLVDTVPFENDVTTKADEPEIDDILTEEFNDFDDVADIAAPLVEISTSDESFNDDLSGFQQLDGLNDAMENKNDTTAGFDLLDDNAVEKEYATPVTDSNDDDSDWMKQLDELDAEQNETAEPVKLDKATEESVDDDMDWMKQLDELDAEQNETAEPVKLDKAADESVDDDMDWMKQLEGMDEHDEDTAKMLMDAGHGHDTEEDAVVDRNFNIAADEPKTSNAVSANAIDEDALIVKAAEMAMSQLKGEQEDAFSQLKDDQNHALSQLRADQDTIESRTRKQFTDAENSRKKTATFGYAALGVGIIGLIGSAGIGWFSYGTKNETTTLTESVTALDEKISAFEVKNTEKEKEIASIKTSVEQLNQKVEKIAAAQVVVPPPVVATAPVVDGTKTDSKTTSPVDLLNGKPSVSPVVAGTKIDATSPMIDAPKVADAEIVPPIDVAPAHPAGVTAEPKVAEQKLSDMAKKVTDDAKAKAAKAEADKATAKAEAELLTQKLTKLSAVAKAAATTSKTDEQRKLLADNQSSRYSGRMTRGMARGGAISKDQQKIIKSAKAENAKTKVESKTAAKKEVLNVAVKPQKATPAGKYSVNVVSYQQEWFAQSKAAEFKQKGIPVEVVPVDPNSHAPRFRLKVSGFKNKNEASAYAKSHGISDAWVGTNE